MVTNEKMLISLLFTVKTKLISSHVLRYNFPVVGDISLYFTKVHLITLYLCDTLILRFLQFLENHENMHVQKYA